MWKDQSKAGGNAGNAAPVPTSSPTRVAGPQDQGGQCATDGGEDQGEDHDQKESDQQAGWREQHPDARFHIRDRSVGANGVDDSCHRIDVFFLAMKHKNPDDEKDRLDTDSNHSGRRPQARCPGRGKNKPTLAAVEKHSQSPGQHDGKKGDQHPQKESKHAALDRGANDHAPVHASTARHGPRIVRGSVGSPGLSGGRRFRHRGIQAAVSRVRSHDLHVDLRSAALRAKGPPVLDRGPALLARVIHVFEASAQRSGEQPAGSERSGLLAPRSDRIVGAGVHADINQSEA